MFEFSGEGLLPPDNNGDVIFVLENFNVGSGNPRLHVVAAFHRDQFIVSSMDYGNAALEMVLHFVQVTVDFPGGSTDNVVKGVPRGVVGVATETFYQERPYPVSGHQFGEKLPEAVVFAN